MGVYHVYYFLLPVREKDTVVRPATSCWVSPMKKKVRNSTVIKIVKYFSPDKGPKTA